MNYVIFHKETTRYLRIIRNRHWQDATFYTSERAAKAGLTREAKKGKINADEYGILPANQFALIEKTEKKRHLLSGVEFEQSVNTPASCDPSTETYHCM
jgi:hypothetical protein